MNIYYNRGHNKFKRGTSKKTRQETKARSKATNTSNTTNTANTTNKSNRAREHLRVPPPILSVSPPPEGRNSAE